MAITAGICNSYKQEILSGTHTSAHTYKWALFTSSATLSNATTSYSSVSGTGQVANGSGYTTGGQAATGFATALSSNTAYLDFTTDPNWTSATITARGALLYNDSLAGKNSVLVLDFTTDQTSTNGTFTIQLPTADASNALLRIT